MTRQLIVNADDFGNSPAVSEGILQAHTAGIVTSTSAMMNIPGAADQVRAVRGKYPNLGIGVHLVLSEGQPLLPPARLKSITAGEGDFPEPEDILGRLESLDFAEVEDEWSAQVELFVNSAGKAPDHLDAHHHMAYMHIEFFQIMLRLACKYGCAIRAAFLVADETDLDNPPVENQGNLPMMKKLLAESGVRHPDYFQHSFYDEVDCQAALRQVFENLPDGSSELMCHPGLVDADLMKRSSYNIQRQKELSALTAPGLKGGLRARGVELINFSSLR